MIPPSVGRAFGIADRVVCVDYDGTIVEWGEIDEPDPVLKTGAREAMVSLRALGYRVVVFTSRLSGLWLDETGRSAYDQYHYIRDVLNRNDIPFDDITAEKIPACAYIDDMAVAFRGDWYSALQEVTA